MRTTREPKNKSYRAGAPFHDTITNSPETSGGTALSLAAAAAASTSAAISSTAAWPAAAAGDTVRARRLTSGGGSAGEDGGASFSGGGGGGRGGDKGGARGVGSLLFPEGSAPASTGVGGGDGYESNPVAGAGPEYHHQHNAEVGMRAAAAAGAAMPGGPGGAAASGSNSSPFGGGAGGGGLVVGNPFAGIGGGDGDGGGASRAGGSGAGTRAAAAAPAFGGAGGGAPGVAGAAAGEGDFVGHPLGPRKASSAFSEPGYTRSVMTAGAAGGQTRREWKYQLEGRSKWWENSKVCMRGVRSFLVLLGKLVTTRVSRMCRRIPVLWSCFDDNACWVVACCVWACASTPPPNRPLFR